MRTGIIGPFMETKLKARFEAESQSFPGGLELKQQ
jgi:hypothetical protein